MLFSSGTFLFVFLPVFLGLYFLPIKSIKYKNAIILIFSILFYAWGEPAFIFLMILCVLMDWIAGLLIEKYKDRGLSKGILIVSLFMHLALLFVFKYLSFTSRELSKIVDVRIYNIALPIGISFFSFQMMSYIIDVYRGDTAAQKNIFKLAIYIMMFPQLIAGPIVRYTQVAKEIDERTITRESIEYGIYRFIFGLAKKVILADMLAVIADNIFGASSVMNVSFAAAWLGGIAYTLDIYFDFSGYSDMAIGLASIMGFRFKENFNYPYTASSVTEFWKRWHISLTDWFRDYIYIPLGGNRVSKSRHIFNLCAVWVLTGIWHGANWTFILWGIIYLLCQLFERYVLNKRKLPKALGFVVTMIIVTCNWCIFKADSIGDALNYLANMFSVRGGFIDADSIYYWKQSLVIIILGILCCIPWREIIGRKRGKVDIHPAVGTLALVGLFFLSALMIINGNYSPFIYFNF